MKLENLTVEEEYPNAFGAVVMYGNIPVAICRPIALHLDGKAAPTTITAEQALSNAKLFAAAPELLESLDSLVAVMLSNGLDDCGAYDVAADLVKRLT